MKLDESDILAEYGLALLKLEANECFWRDDDIRSAENLKRIHSLQRRVKDYYNKHPDARLKKYMQKKKMVKSGNINMDMATVCAVVMARYFFKDQDYTNVTWVSRLCYLSSEAKKKSIRYYHMLVREMTLAGIIVLQPTNKHLKMTFPASVTMGSCLKKDALGFEPMTDHSILKEHRVRARKRRRNRLEGDK